MKEKKAKTTTTPTTAVTMSKMIGKKQMVLVYKSNRERNRRKNTEKTNSGSLYVLKCIGKSLQNGQKFVVIETNENSHSHTEQWST